jgi:hypothetical protein
MLAQAVAQEAGATFFNADTTTGTLPNGSITSISRIVAEKSSAPILPSYGPSAVFAARRVPGSALDGVG